MSFYDGLKVPGQDLIFGGARLGTQVKHPLSDLLPASFRGVEFFVRDESAKGIGRRISAHEYPNSDRRFIEDVGKVLPIISVTAFVCGPDWVEKTGELSVALKKKGPGRLVLPFFASFIAFVAPFSIKVDQRELGCTEFQIDFYYGDNTVQQPEPQKTPADVSAKAKTALDKIKDKFNELKEEVSSAYAAAQEQIDMIKSSEFVAGISEVMTMASDAADAIKLASDIAGRATEFVKNPVGYGMAMFLPSGVSPGLWQIASYFTSDNAKQTSSAALGFAKAFGSGDSGVPYAIALHEPTTWIRKEANDSRIAIVDANRVAALVLANNAVAATEFDTREEILQARAELSKAYNAIMRAGHPISSSGEVMVAVNEVVAATISVLEAQAQNKYLTENLLIQTPVAAPVLAYRLYGEIGLHDAAQTLRALNLGENSLALRGDVVVYRGGEHA